MSILRYLRESLLSEAPRTTEYLKQIPKFKDIEPKVFDSMESIGFNELNGGGYNEWILNQYLKMNDDAKKRFITDHDIHQVFNALKVFHEKKNKGFFTDPKDINQYKSIADLYQATSKYKDQTSKGDLKVKSSQVPTEDLNKIFEDDEWMIFVPKTKKASCVLGRGTQWCTASQGDSNMYDHYSKDGPLYVFINKKDPTRKFQFHQVANQLMDKNDYPITLEDAMDLYPYSKKLNLDFSNHLSLDKVLQNNNEKNEKIVYKYVKNHVPPTTEIDAEGDDYNNIARRILNVSMNYEWLDVVRLLLNDNRIIPDNSLIRWAVEKGYTDIVKILLSNKNVDPVAPYYIRDLDMHVKNKPIIDAAKLGHTDIVKLLLADPRVDPTVNNNGPLRLAIKNGHHDIVELLKQHKK